MAFLDTRVDAWSAFEMRSAVSDKPKDGYAPFPRLSEPSWSFQPYKGNKDEKRQASGPPDFLTGDITVIIPTTYKPVRSD